ncbi:hypothetical protein VWN47_10250, partial [Campylobacter jejuni]
ATRIGLDFLPMEDDSEIQVLLESKKDLSLEAMKEKSLNLLEKLSLIKEGLLGTCTHLMNEKEVNEIIKSGKFKGESFPYPLSFA